MDTGGDVQDALEVVTDLLAWRLDTAGWQRVALVLETLESALRTGDEQALAARTAELETLSPYRIVPISLDHPAPASLRLRANRLIHTLTGERPAVPPVSRNPPAGATGFRQELVVHAFAPLDDPWAEPAYQQIRRLWTRAAQVLAATAALGEPGLPDNAQRLPSGPLLAGRQRPDESTQMVLRREHDALVLSIGWRAAAGWEECEQQWARIAQDDTGELLGVALLRIGLTPPGGVREPTGTALPEAGTLEELAPCDAPERQRRLLLAVASEDREAALSALVWSGGSPAMPPLARYLLDAAKVRYELRVRQAEGSALRQAVTSGTERELAGLSTLLDDLRLTVGIARSNMATVLSAIGMDAGNPAGLFDDDLRTTDWFAETLDDDLRYLGNARERSRYRGAVPADVGTPAAGIITAMPEEYAAMALLLDDTVERNIAGDDALYLTGTVPSTDAGRPHPVVLTMLGGTGTNDAAAQVAHLVRSFPGVSQVLMVGIAAGVPSPDHPDQHVRLGDIVVSTWGIADYDHVVDRPEGETPRMEPPRPSHLLVTRANMLRADEILGNRRWEPELDRLIELQPAFARPGETTDVLYVSDDPGAEQRPHPAPELSGHRPGRPKVHLGKIGSANRSLRNANVRDELAARHMLRAIEMEGAGVAWSAFASSRQWLMIRGISDYADSRMATSWRKHASAVAAAYTRALLSRCPPIDPARP
jgi:nucleoside phosphorylase